MVNGVKGGCEERPGPVVPRLRRVHTYIINAEAKHSKINHLYEIQKNMTASKIALGCMCYNPRKPGMLLVSSAKNRAGTNQLFARVQIVQKLKRFWPQMPADFWACTTQTECFQPLCAQVHWD